MNTKLGMGRRWRSVLLLAALGAGGCGDDLHANLVRVDTVAVGDTGCPAGGVRIHQGRDANGNGVLEDTEITSTVDSCEDGNVLTTATRLEPGDTDCPAGGYEVAYGLDNGDGGGTAANGTLEAGEIDDVAAICDQSSFASPVGTDAPAGDVGTNVLRTAGGASTTGQAGNGGTIQIVGSTGVHHAQVFRTGSFARTVTLPAFEVDLGATPVEVTTSRTIGNNPGGMDGVFYQDGTGIVVVTGGGTVTTPATGLHVAAGVTLTIPNQADDSIGLSFTGDVHLEGTITIGVAADERDSLSISANDFWAAEGSSFDLVTDANAATLTVQAQRVASAADVLASSAAGLPGAVVLVGLSSLVNLGDIDVSGADGAAPTGGGSAQLVSYASLENAGNIDAAGGGGAVATASNGGAVVFVSGLVLGGELVNTGTLDTSGGTATAAASTGGNAGSITLQAISGGLISTGDLLAVGGAGVGTGGIGGPILSVQVPSGPSPNGAAPMRFDCTLDTQGGSGVIGGNGGPIQVVTQTIGAEAIVFYGVERIATDGGDASDPAGLGGDAGDLAVSLTVAGPPGLPSGVIVLRTALSLMGGVGGGEGGAVTLNNQNADETYGTPTGTLPGVIVEGDADLRGADDDNAAGGVGGAFVLQTSRSVEIVGNIVTRGGTCGNNTANGAVGGVIQLQTLQGDLAVTGDLDGSGGDGLAGGNGANIVVASSHSVVDGDILSIGGEGTTNGGNGGTVQFSSAGTTGDVTGVVDVSGGVGAGTNGADGVVLGAI